MKKATTFEINNFAELKIKMLDWSKQFNIFCLLDNSGYQFEAPAFECLLGVGCKANIQVSAGNAFGALKAFNAAHNDWLFGHLAYDLKNETEQLHSNNFDGIGFSALHFFVPEIVLQLSHHELTIFYDDGEAEQIYAAINRASSSTKEEKVAAFTIADSFTKSEYIKTIQKLQQHILRGDCYEINFCQDFFSTNATIDPVTVYHKLTSLSPNPTSGIKKKKH